MVEASDLLQRLRELPDLELNCDVESLLRAYQAES